MESENGSIKRTMTTVINLYVIDKIFNEEAKVKLSSASQALYINCLMHHFRNKPATFNSAMAFNIFKDDIKNIDYWNKEIIQLHKAGLITVDINTITFNNSWGKHIDRTLLDKENNNEYNPGMSIKLASGWKNDLLNSSQLYELTVIKHKITKVNFIKLIELFVKEQDAYDKKYNNFSECARHFNYWVVNNVDKVPKEIVKSNGKILGI